MQEFKYFEMRRVWDQRPYRVLTLDGKRWFTEAESRDVPIYRVRVGDSPKDAKDLPGLYGAVIDVKDPNSDLLYTLKKAGFETNNVQKDPAVEVLLRPVMFKNHLDPVGEALDLVVQQAQLKIVADPGTGESITLFSATNAQVVQQLMKPGLLAELLPQQIFNALGVPETVLKPPGPSALLAKIDEALALANEQESFVPKIEEEVEVTPLQMLSGMVTIFPGGSSSKKLKPGPPQIAFPEKVEVVPPVPLNLPTQSTRIPVGGRRKIRVKE